MLAESKCYCEFENGYHENSGILCEKNGTFQKAIVCGSKAFCTGPSSEQDAANGTSGMCTSNMEQVPGKVIIA